MWDPFPKLKSERKAATRNPLKWEDRFILNVFIMIDAIIFVDYEIKKNINNNKGKFKKRSGNGFVTHTDSITFNLILPDWVVSLFNVVN